MCKGYAMIADGLKLMAAGYELLASAETSQTNTAPAEPVKEAVPEAPKAEVKAEPKKEEKKVSVVDVRALMHQKIKDGKMEACQEVLQSFGCDRLSDVPEEKLPELFGKVEVL